NTVAGGADPAHISTDKSGKFLFTAYYVAGKVTVHDIGPDGSLSKEPRQTIVTKEKAHAIVQSPSENAVLVPHTRPNVIYALVWLGTEGKLWAGIHRSEFETPKNTGPRHAIFHPTLRIDGGVDAEAKVVYVANEQGGSVTMYHAILNPFNCLLEPKQTVST